MSDNLFTKEETPTNMVPQAPTAPSGEPKPTETTVVTDPFANQLAGIVNPDGRQKYADVATALNSITHAQSHIAELTLKNAELEATAAASVGMEQVLQRIDSSNQTPDAPSVVGLGEDKVRELLESTLSQRDAASIAHANEVELTNGLVAKFGTQEKAVEMLGNKATELGVSIDFMQKLAQQSPKAVLSYFGAEPTANATPTAPGINTAAIQAPAGDVDHLAEATAKLMGQRDPLVTKWRAASAQTQTN